MLIFLQIILGVLIIGTILLQSRGAGIGSAWGGSGELYATRRGVEKTIFRLTIIFVALFIIISILRFLT